MILLWLCLIYCQERPFCDIKRFFDGKRLSAFKEKEPSLVSVLFIKSGVNCNWLA